jgi:hypothetical protein
LDYGCGSTILRDELGLLASKKVKVFFWILRHGRTRTRASLHHHGVLDALDYRFCLGTPEDEDHLFATYPHLGQLWTRLLPGQTPPTTARHATEALEVLFPALPHVQNTLLPDRNSAVTGKTGPVCSGSKIAQLTRVLPHMVELKKPTSVN